MPDTGLLVLSMLSVGVGVLLVLSPNTLLLLSRTLNRTITTLDEALIRSRYLWALLLVLAGYGLFQLALMLPSS